MKTFWIIGCGPSLRGVDLSFLADRRVIAINRAHEIVPSTLAEGHIWFSDWRFWDLHWRALVTSTFKLHTIADPAGRPYVGRDDLRVWRNTGLTGLDTDLGIRVGNNGGHAALNLAFHLEADRIVLLGYDMRLADDGAGHFHEEHPWGNLRARTLREKMLPYFGQIAEDLDREGVVVFNATPGSALECFHKISLDEAKEIEP